MEANIGMCRIDIRFPIGWIHATRSDAIVILIANERNGRHFGPYCRIENGLRTEIVSVSHGAM